jgi:hypothetical protein
MRLVLAIIAVSSLVAGCVPSGQPVENTSNPENVSNQSFVCPDTERLEYDNETNTYYEYRNCMPGPRRLPDCGDIDQDRVDWIEENCGFNYTVSIAY